MKEIVTVQVGGCGVLLGRRFWEGVCHERGISSDGTCEGDAWGGQYRNHELFEEGRDGRLVPRSVMVDDDTGSLDALEGSSEGGLFRPDYAVRGNGSIGVWPKGKYNADTAETAFDVCRKQAENTDRLAGIQLCHSIVGGSGSGTGSALLSRLREEFCDTIVMTYTVTDAKPQEAWNPLGPYNAVLASHPLVEFADLCVLIDGKILRQDRSRDFTRGCFTDTASVMRAVCCNKTYGLRKLCTTVVPFPRLHFFIPTYVTARETDPLPLRCLVNRAFEPKSFLFPGYGKTPFTAALYVHGRSVSHHHVSELAQNAIPHAGPNMWLPDKVTSAIAESDTASVTALANDPKSMYDYSHAMGECFTAMFRKKAYLHWYLAEGMDEMEFTEAESNMNDLICEYNWSSVNGSCCLEDFEEEGDYEEED